MTLAVLTHASSLENEHQLIEKMFKRGLKNLHVRKPAYSKEQLKKYIEKFPREYRNKMIIHSHHSLALSMGLKGIHLTEKHRKDSFGVWKKFNLFRLVRPHMHISGSFHMINDLKHNGGRFDYAFFSPVFESISKENHKPDYSLRTIFNLLNNRKEINAIALGGIENSNITACFETLFSGVALSGYLWLSNNPVELFEEAKKTWEQNKKA